MRGQNAQVVEVLQMIFESADGRYPTVEELVVCDLFRNIDLREMRGPGISVSSELNFKNNKYFSIYCHLLVIQKWAEHLYAEPA